MTLTKEWLQKTIAELEEERDSMPGVVNVDAAMALVAMKIALASLEAEKGAEPVAKVETVGVCWYADNGVPRKPAVGTELFAAPPAPIVTVRELTMWVKRLAHSLRNAKSGSKLPDDAMAYLSAKGLIGVEDALR